MKKTKNFASRWGFILASVGSAVGMANVWGFPHKLGRKRRRSVSADISAVCVSYSAMSACRRSLPSGRRAGTGTLGAYRIAHGRRAAKGFGKAGGILGVASARRFAVHRHRICRYRRHTSSRRLSIPSSATLMTTDTAVWFGELFAQLRCPLCRITSSS